MGDYWADITPVSLALAPLSWLYSAGWRAYDTVYRLGIKKPATPHRPVMLVGNLVVGGSGKTPLTLHLAQTVKALGKDVVIGLSGYGSPASQAAQLAPEGPLNARDWGDEPSMVRWLLPHVPLVVGRRRVLAAEICHKKFPNAVLLMDDGFQHLPLKKHLSIILDPETKNHFCLPAGPYRQPWREGLSKADLVLNIASKFRLEQAPTTFLNSQKDAVLKPERAQLLCALGDPRRLLASLNAQNIGLEQSRLLRDHDPLTAGNLMDGFSKGLPILVTAKDWVKLRNREDIHGFEFVIATYEVRIQPEGEFRTWLNTRLNEICS